METIQKHLIDNIDLILDNFSNDKLITKKEELEQEVKNIREVERIKQHNYYLKNSATILARNRENYKKNIEKERIKDKLYYEKHKEEKREYARGYYANNREKLKEQHRIYYANNREKMIEYSKNYKKKKRIEKKKERKMFEKEKVEFIKNSLTSISNEIINLQIGIDNDIDIYSIQLSLKDIRNRTKQLYIMVNDEVCLLNQRNFYKRYNG